VRNEGILPLSLPKALLIEWGNAPYFRAALQRHGTFKHYSLDAPEWLSQLDEQTTLIVSLAAIKSRPPDFGLNEIQEPLHLLSQHPHVVCVLFGTPYSLAKIPLFDGLIMAYENEREAQEAAAEVLLGQLPPRGHLPVSILPHFPCGTGLH
jgi:hypothetical protein